MLGMLGIYSAPAIFFDLAYSPSDHWVTFFLAGITVGIYAQVTNMERNSRLPGVDGKNPSQSFQPVALELIGPRLHVADPPTEKS
jgi:hypothetical protein